MVGNTGLALVLICSLVAATIFGGLLLIFLAHYFLSAFEETFAGEDGISWDDDPIFDLVWKPIYLLGLLVVPSVPVAVGLAALVPAVARDSRGVLAALALVAWLAFPILLLSSYCSGRWWSLHLNVLGGLIRNAGAAFLYFLLSGLLLGGAAAILYYVVFGNFTALLSAAALAGAIPLLHGRLLGRLAWLLDHPLRGKKRRKRSRPRRTRLSEPSEDSEKLAETVPLAPVNDQITAGAAALREPTIRLPDGSLEDAEDEWDPYKKPYRVLSETEVEIAAMKKDENRDPGVIGPLQDLPPLGVEKAPIMAGKTSVQFHSLFELLIGGVWAFPFYGNNLMKWLNASFLVFVVALLIRLLRLVWIV